MHLPQYRDSDDSTTEELNLLDDFDKEAESSVEEVMSPMSPMPYGIRLPSMPETPSFTQQLTKFLFFLLPSFIQNRIRPAPKAGKMHPTAFLDGMRGIASLLVFVFHLVVCSYDAKRGFASGDHGEYRNFFKLPFIRIIYAGPTMVSLFFVVSGYALSYKPVKLMRNKNWKDLLHTSASSIFRRAIRLYLPCLVSTFFIVIIVKMGAYEWGRAYAESRGQYTDRHDHPVLHYDTLHEQLWYWVTEMWVFINPMTFRAQGNEMLIDGHLWTIPVEFRSSLILYLTQVGLARVKVKVRMATLVALIIWCHSRARWEMILFYGGFLCAELDFNRATPSESVLPFGSVTLSTRNRRLWNLFYIFVFMLGMYLGCQPMKRAPNTPGWMTLYAMIPDYAGAKKRYWVGWGSLMMVWSTSCHTGLQKLFTNGPVQYLGKISFSLYIMHGWVTHTFGYALMNVMWGYYGQEDGYYKNLGWGVGFSATLLITIWTADIFTRAVDTPTVRFAKWLEEKCTVALEEK